MPAGPLDQCRGARVRRAVQAALWWRPGPVTGRLLGTLLHAIDSATHMQAKRGGLKDTLPDDMLHAVFTATLERTGLNPAVGWPIRP